MSASSSSARPRRGIAAALALLLLVAVGVSVALMVRRTREAAQSPPVRFAGARTVIPMPSVLPEPQLGEPLRVTILRDARSASYFDSASTFDSAIAGWRDALRAVGAEVHVASPAEVAAWTDAEVLVVPSSPCLGVEAREVLQRAAERGQGLIMTTSTGVFDGTCARVGYGLTVAATAALRADTLETRPMVYVTIPASSPIGSGLPPGSRVEVNPGGHVALRRHGRDAFYSEYDMDPAPSRQRPLLDAAIAHGAFGRGRAVYWGFELDDVVTLPWNRTVIATLVRNSVAWAAGRPLASIEPWPRGLDAAVVLAQDVEAEFTNARYAMDSLRAIGVPATYFLTSDLALKYRRLARALASHGEIGTHTDRHQLLGGAPADSQSAWLRKTKADLTELLEKPITGLRPPEEQFDTTTLAEWVRAGGVYVFGANNSRVAAPELLAVGRDTVVLLARATDDDVIAVHMSGPNPVRALTARFRSDFARVRALGGLYLFSYHSQLLSRPELVPALANIARTVASDSRVWRTTAGEVAAWWRGRAALGVTVQRDARGGVTIAVQNDGTGPVRHAIARVVLGPGERATWSDGHLVDAPVGAARIALPVLQPGERRVISIAVRRGDGE